MHFRTVDVDLLEESQVLNDMLALLVQITQAVQFAGQFLVAQFLADADVVCELSEDRQLRMPLGELVQRQKILLCVVFLPLVEADDRQKCNLAKVHITELDSALLELFHFEFRLRFLIEVCRLLLVDHFLLLFYAYSIFTQLICGVRNPRLVLFDSAERVLEVDLV